MGYLIAVDLGTAGCKTILFDANGHSVAQAYAEYPLYTLGPTLIEQDPSDWWNATSKGIREVLQSCHVPPKEVVAVGCGGHFPTLVFLDQHGQVLRRAMIYCDMRAAKQSEEILSKGNAEGILKITGLPASTFPGLPVAKILWLRENEPHLTKSVWKVLGTKDFVNFRLTGNVAVDYFEAWWTGLADVVDYSWSERLMDEWKIPRDWLGEIHLPQEIIGEVTEQAAAMTGLAMGTPVVCGSGDGLCNVIGTGLLESGITMDSAGVTEIIASISKSPLAPSVGESFTSWRHPNSQDWVLYTSTSSAGLSLRWFKDQVAQLERSDSPIQGSDYERLDKEAEEADAGSGRLLFLPYLTGEYSPFFDLNARGAFLGISLETQRRHLTRAVLEGVAFSLRHVLEYFEGLGVETHSIRSSGGGSRSKLWNQIKADVTGKPISTLEIVESGCLGAAVLAGVAVGQYRNLEAATKAMVRIGDTLFPNEANHTMYSKQFQIYKESYTKLKETFAKLADL